MKYVFGLIVAILCLTGLTSCHSRTSENTIKVGAMSGPEATLMTTVQQVLQKNYGITMDIVTFTDYSIPNEALNNGDLNANYFQHVPFLNAQIKAHHYDLSVIGNGFIYPMGIYSQKILSLNQLKSGDKVGIPNDPSNEARALLLLQHAGLIKLGNNVTSDATILDITSNPKNLQITALDAAQLPRALNDLTIAAINTTYASAAGLDLNAALFKEDKSSPYVNIVVVRTADKNNPALQDLVKALHSPEVVSKARELFGNGAIQGW